MNVHVWINRLLGNDIRSGQFTRYEYGNNQKKVGQIIDLPHLASCLQARGFRWAYKFGSNNLHPLLCFESGSWNYLPLKRHVMLLALILSSSWGICLRINWQSLFKKPCILITLPTSYCNELQESITCHVLPFVCLKSMHANKVFIWK